MCILELRRYGVWREVKEDKAGLFIVVESVVGYREDEKYSKIDNGYISYFLYLSIIVRG